MLLFADYYHYYNVPLGSNWIFFFFGRKSLSRIPFASYQLKISTKQIFPAEPKCFQKLCTWGCTKRFQVFEKIMINDDICIIHNNVSYLLIYWSQCNGILLYEYLRIPFGIDFFSNSYLYVETIFRFWDFRVVLNDIMFTFHVSRFNKLHHLTAHCRYCIKYWTPDDEWLSEFQSILISWYAFRSNCPFKNLQNVMAPLIIIFNHFLI